MICKSIKPKENLKVVYFCVGFLFIAISAGIFVGFGHDDHYTASHTTGVVESNNPLGEAKGVFPIRVVSYHHPDATDENWTTKSPNNYNSNTHTNADTLEKMVTTSLFKLENSHPRKESVLINYYYLD